LEYLVAEKELCRVSVDIDDALEVMQFNQKKFMEN